MQWYDVLKLSPLFFYDESLFGCLTRTPEFSFYKDVWGAWKMRALHPFLRLHYVDLVVLNIQNYCLTWFIFLNLIAWCLYLQFDICSFTSKLIAYVLYILLGSCMDEVEDVIHHFLNHKIALKQLCTCVLIAI